MNTERIDELARALASGSSRRRTLQVLAAFAFGGALAGLQPPTAEADRLCKPAGNKPQSRCQKNAQCCSGRCSNGTCCTPKTCVADYPGQCGTELSDGCGGTLNCSAACPSSQVCVTQATPRICCRPLSCQDQSIFCGPAGNGCGGLQSCGTCTPPQTCGGGGIAGQCGGGPS